MPVAITGSTGIDYDVTGEGLPLLLVGGLGSSRVGEHKWRRLQEYFGRRAHPSPSFHGRPGLLGAWEERVI